MSHTFTHVSLFERASPAVQLKALADFAMSSGNIISTDIDVFQDRLERYARKAGITLEQARNNVKTTCGNMLSSNMIAFGLE